MAFPAKKLPAPMNDWPMPLPVNMDERLDRPPIMPPPPIAWPPALAIPLPNEPIIPALAAAMLIIKRRLAKTINSAITSFTIEVALSRKEINVLFPPSKISLNVERNESVIFSAVASYCSCTSSCSAICASANAVALAAASSNARFWL